MDNGFRDTANMQELFQPVSEQQNSQQMKEAWQDHIKAVASAYEDANNCSNTQIGGRLLDFLRLQMPLAYARFDVDADGHWGLEEEVEDLHED